MAAPMYGTIFAWELLNGDSSYAESEGELVKRRYYVPLDDANTSVLELLAKALDRALEADDNDNGANSDGDLACALEHECVPETGPVVYAVGGLGARSVGNRMRRAMRPPCSLDDILVDARRRVARWRCALEDPDVPDDPTPAAASQSLRREPHADEYHWYLRGAGLNPLGIVRSLLHRAEPATLPCAGCSLRCGAAGLCLIPANLFAEATFATSVPSCALLHLDSRRRVVIPPVLRMPAEPQIPLEAASPTLSALCEASTGAR